MSRKTLPDFRDISDGLRKLRNILMGRKHTLQARHAPYLAPRTIPRPDIPRATPDYKYSKQYYCNRSAMDSVKPPVEAYNVQSKTEELKTIPKFECPPTPGDSWGWDNHCYYEGDKKKCT